MSQKSKSKLGEQLVDQEGGLFHILVQQVDMHKAISVSLVVNNSKSLSVKVVSVPLHFVHLVGVVMVLLVGDDLEVVYRVFSEIHLLIRIHSS